MNLTVVVLLGALWAAILAPGLFRGRGGRSPSATVNSFERSMGILASERFTAPRMPGRHVMVVHDPARLARRPAAARAQRRRRQILHGLTTVVALTGVAAVAWGGAFVMAFGGAAAVVCAYLGLLVQLRAVDRRGRRVVRHLDAADAPRARPVSARRTDRIA